MSWTDDRTELLKKLWADGLSADQIAGELGGITRNAVIGKVYRLGLSGRKRSPQGSTYLKPKKVKQPPAVKQSSMLLQPPHITSLDRALKDNPEPEVEQLEIPVEQRRTLFDLVEGVCAYPCGDPATPEFYFCGGKSISARVSYCAYHSRISHQPMSARRGSDRSYRS